MDIKKFKRIEMVSELKEMDKEKLNDYALKVKYSPSEIDKIIKNEVKKQGYDMDIHTDYIILENDLNGGSIVISDKINILMGVIYDYETYPFEI